MIVSSRFSTRRAKTTPRTSPNKVARAMFRNFLGENGELGSGAGSITDTLEDTMVLDILTSLTLANRAWYSCSLVWASRLRIW